MKPAWKVDERFENYDASMYMKLAITKFVEEIEKIQRVCSAFGVSSLCFTLWSNLTAGTRCEI